MSPGKYNEERKVWVIEEPKREWYSVQDVSRISGTGGPSVYNAIKRGSLIGYMVNNHTRVKHEDLVKYIEQKGKAQSLTATTDQLIQKIMPDPENKKAAASIAQEVALERPKLNLDLFDDDEDDDDSTEGVPDPRDASPADVADIENQISVKLP